jgi:hypothetical protein
MRKVDAVDTVTAQANLAIAVVTGGVAVSLLVGFAGLSIRWWIAKQRRIVHRVVLAVAIAAFVVAVVGIIGLMIPRSNIIWDGGYSPDEIRLTIQDEEGNPVQGVELHVEHDSGSRFYFYPVTDYLPGQIPTSDINGRMVFHQASHDFVYISGRVVVLFGFMTFGSWEGPHYPCRFFYHGREVHREFFHEITSEKHTTGSIKRNWRTPNWPYDVGRSLLAEGKDMEDPKNWTEFGFRFDGKCNREERYTFYAARRSAERQMENEGRALEKEMVMGVTERTIKIKVR